MIKKQLIITKMELSWKGIKLKLRGPLTPPDKWLWKSGRIPKDIEKSKKGYTVGFPYITLFIFRVIPNARSLLTIYESNIGGNNHG